MDVPKDKITNIEDGETFLLTMPTSNYFAYETPMDTQLQLKAAKLDVNTIIHVTCDDVMGEYDLCDITSELLYDVADTWCDLETYYYTMEVKQITLTYALVQVCRYEYSELQC